MKVPPIKYRETKVTGSRPHDGFTLIELLVSMAILLIIVLIVSMIFQRASVAWDTGMRKAELDMTGRSLADFMAQELSMAVRDTNNYATFSVSGNAATFWVLGDADANGACHEIVYSGSGNPSRTQDGGSNSVLAEGVNVVFTTEPSPPLAGELPKYADVTVSVTNNYGETITYQSRAHFMNRNRNRF